MPRPIIFGDIDGIEEGHWFSSRKEMMPSSFHRNHGKGIDGNGSEGTAAIVLSGGYEDDQDNGEEIIYTGEGGIDRSTNKQVSDQSWDSPGNAGLLKSADDGLPVRVIRGHTHKSKWSPETGYLYSGTYSVVDAWQERGKRGFIIADLGSSIAVRAWADALQWKWSWITRSDKNVDAQIQSSELFEIVKFQQTLKDFTATGVKCAIWRSRRKKGFMQKAHILSLLELLTMETIVFPIFFAYARIITLCLTKDRFQYETILG